MANTEKLGDLKGNVEKENVKNQTTADKLGSVQGEKGKLAAAFRLIPNQIKTIEEKYMDIVRRG